ncbi:MAG: serine hydrolase [Bdellovibrionales bacterium]
MTRFALALGAAALVAAILASTFRSPPEWIAPLNAELSQIDAKFEGDVGVYVKRLQDGGEVDFGSDRSWYLASTVKVLVAAALLNEVERGSLSLDEKIQLKTSDFIDGSGEVMRKKPGSRLRIGYLLEQMLEQSDSTATDLLIRRVGLERINSFVANQSPGFGPITSILDVRYQAYAEAHPNAKILTNLDFIRLKRVPSSRRLQAFARRIRVPVRDLKVKTLNEAFELYYQKGMNSAPLKSYGGFLERLLAGGMLSPHSTRLLTSHMERAITGERRIKAGLPKGFRFAQKTGTQEARVCNVGMIRPPNGDDRVIIAACLQKFTSFRKAEATLRDVGRALIRAGVFQSWKPTGSRGD